MTFEELRVKYEKKAIECQKEESAVLLYLMHASNLTSTELYIKYRDKVDNKILENFESGINEYLYNNKPIQYLIGYQTFYGYDFTCNEGCLIPRFETEELVENILLEYDKFFDGKHVDVCDIGTGSGCVGITLALEEKNMNVTLTDISQEALDVALSNAKKLGANVKVLQGDMVKPLYGMKFDIIASNPPYIPESENVEKLVVDNEPNIALFGGVDGLDFYKIIVNDAKNIAKDKFMFAFEHAYDKNAEIKEIILNEYPNAYVKQIKDMQQRDRMTLAFIGGKYED